MSETQLYESVMATLGQLRDFYAARNADSHARRIEHITHQLADTHAWYEDPTFEEPSN